MKTNYLKCLMLIPVIGTFFCLNAQSSDCSYGGTALTVGSSCVTSTFDSNNNTDYWNSASGCSGTDNDDAWWWFTATSTNTTITYNSTNDAIMHLFTGACATNMTALTCVNATTTGNETITYATSIGVSYAIRIQRNASDQSMTGTICVYNTAVPPPATNNDVCSNAIDVVCGGTYTGTTTAATTTGDPTSLCGTTPAAPGVWYKITGTGSTVTASLCGSSYDTKINVYSGTCASLTCIDGNDDFCGSSSQVSFETTVGVTYYILVNGYSGGVGNFSLAISCCTPTVPNCVTTPIPANGSTGIEPCGVVLFWTAPAAGACPGAITYDVYFGTSSTPPFVVNTASTSYSLPNLNANTTYYWKIVPRRSAGPAVGCATYSFTTNPNFSTSADAFSNSPYNCVTLTTAGLWQRGCAWNPGTLNFAAPFSLEYVVNLGNLPAADGITFTIQNDPAGRCACGASAIGLGTSGIQNGLTLEIDTYMNDNDRDDFCGADNVGCSGTQDWDHLDIWTTANFNPDLDGNNCNNVAAGERPNVTCAVPLKNSGAGYNIENGLDHLMRISWVPGSPGTITMTVLNAAGTITYGTISYSFNPMTVFGTNTPFFGLTGATGGSGNLQTACMSSTSLPIELINFDATLNQKQTVDLTWETESERENDYFTIERSNDGSKWDFIGNVDGAGTTAIPQSYYLEDNNPNFGLNYYRLKQTDFNGEFKYSDIKAVTVMKKDDYIIFPNPSKNEFTIHGINKEIELIQIFDNVGKSIPFSFNKSSGYETHISSEYLANGIYYVSINFGSNQKIIKHTIVK